MEEQAVVIPDTKYLSHVEALCRREEPYLEDDECDHLFVKAMQDIIDWHRNRCSFYGQLLQAHDFRSDQLQTAESLHTIPHIHANFFKRHEILSVPREEIALHLTSSGTTGQKSQMFFDAWSIGIARQMVDKVFGHNGLVGEGEPVNYLLFSYEPVSGMQLGTANTNEFLTAYAPGKNIFHAIRSTGKGHEFDLFGTMEKLQEYAADDAPTRIFGFPAFAWFTLERMRALGMDALQLPTGSLAFFGGGWKGHADREVTKEELYTALEQQLGLVTERIRQSYGAVEHSVPYVECSHHNLHRPIWSRILIRDVKTLDELGYDEVGYLQFLTPYITSTPAQSVLMGDLASLHPGKDCPCELETPFFRIQGRAGTSKNKSCAMAAAELLG
jgi:phenylacetate-coenzyme A ligase PaaK-like adenylate-forming protein